MPTTAPHPTPADLPTPKRLHVGSEVGALRRVLVHRPGGELRRLTPRTRRELLFSDVLWVERAQEEHDAFVATLRGHGVEVLELQRLLAEALGMPGVTDEVLDATVATVDLGPRLNADVRMWLASLDPVELAGRLVEGVTAAELPFASDSLTALVLPPSGFVLRPLPNHLFPRDTSAWIDGGVAVNTMAKLVRRREPLPVDAIYRHHPCFAAAHFERWAERSGEAAAVEGGDVHVLGRGCVLVGLDEWTRPAAVERLAGRLFDHGVATSVIAVDLPADRGVAHLAPVMSMLDVDTFTVAPDVRPLLRSYRLTPGAHGVDAAPLDDLFDGIADALGVDGLRLVPTGGEHVGDGHEQWDDGNDVLAIAPGVVVSYERNVVTNHRMRAAGMEVVEVPGCELGRSGGGPRRLTCPIERDDLPA